MNNEHNPIKNWQELQKSLIKQIPLPGNNNGFENLAHKAIRDFMQNSLPHQPAFQTFSAAEEVEYDLFESQRVIFVRCKVPANTSDPELRFFANKTRLQIEYAGRTQEISLPSEVNPSRASARMDGDVVEISLPKSRDSEPFHQILIRE